jgi:hypothetical protein
MSMQLVFLWADKLCAWKLSFYKVGECVMERTEKRQLFVFDEVWKNQMRPIVLHMNRLNRMVEKGGVICE